MIQIDPDQFDRWLAEQAWLSRPDSGIRFQIRNKAELRRYECEIAEGSALVGCNMARCFLHDIEPPGFTGGALWIARTPWDEDMDSFAKRVFQGCGIPNADWARFYLLFEKDDYETCFAIIALAMMFGWDANFVATGKRFLLEIDDEPFPALIVESVSPWFAEVAKNLEFKITEVGVTTSSGP